MTNILSKNPLTQTIVDGNASDDLLDMLINKQLPFTEEEYLESLVFILKNEKYKLKAIGMLKEIGENSKASYVEKLKANHRVAFFIILDALNKGSLQIITKAVRNQGLPYEFLLKIAEKGNTQMLEVLKDNQVKLIAYPEIMDEIEKNPAINMFILGRIKEIREFYLEKNEVEEIPQELVMEDVKELLSQESPDSDEDEDDEELLGDDVEEKALNALQQINCMSISERIKLALTGSKTQRMILIKDANKMVALAVLESPKISTNEISLLAKNKSVSMEIMAIICRNREWIKNYSIMIELVRNPKTPVKNALAFVKKLHIKDLQSVGRDRNAPPVVRTLATNFFNKKSGIK